VVTPTFNRGNLLLARAYKSLIQQTYKEWEWIVIGDLCTDNTSELMRELEQEDERVTYYAIPSYQKDLPTVERRWFCGPIVALNYALSKLPTHHSHWIAHIDDDDVWHKDHLKDALDFALKNNLEFVSAYNEETRNGIKSVIKDDPATPGIGARSTWLYRSYLSFMKYNVNCYRKRINRVNDLDMAERMIKARVRIGQIQAVHSYQIPRPGESQIGLKAYKEAEQKGVKVHD
jgi:glycosyltransferase involved in cell wall biosynthesis